MGGKVPQSETLYHADVAKNPVENAGSCIGAEVLSLPLAVGSVTCADRRAIA